MTFGRKLSVGLVGLFLAVLVASTPAAAQQQQQRRPNILVIMGDDVGWFNIGAYHQGIMSGKTPNLDKLASEGMRFTDYYAEASCTAGRANFITGELPIRTGLTTVGQAGADVGMPAQAVTLATALKAQGYATGQFGKNHLGDLNKFLPTLHGFDEFFGYLYHLDAMSDPYWYSFPIDEKYYNTYGPRSLIHSFATDRDDPTEMPRWGKIGKQRIVDEGPLPPFPNMSNVQNMHDLPFLKAKYDMTTFDEVLVKASSDFMDKAKRDNKPFFVWHNTTRMHVWTFLSEKYKAMQNSQTNYGLEEAGMAQMDDSIGALLKKHRRHRRDQQHHRDLHDRQRRRGVHVAGWRHDAVQEHQGHRRRRWLPRAGHHPLAGPGQAGLGRERHLLGTRLVAHARWLPPETRTSPTNFSKGVQLGDRTYKNHLDGYNQMDLITGKGPSKRHEIFYFGGAELGAVRLDDFKFSFLPAALWLAGRKDHHRHARDGQHPPGSVRTHAQYSRPVAKHGCFRLRQ